MLQEVHENGHRSTDKETGFVSHGHMIDKGIDQLDKALYYQRMTIPPNSEEANKAIVLEVLDRIFVKNDLTIGDDHPGLSETVKEMPRRAAAFPDLAFTVDAMIADGDRVAYRVWLKGTHLGNFAGMPATGKPIEYQAFGLDRLEGGKIVEHHATGDFLGVLGQLGALPLKHA
jgi:predicted ester cyclase